MSALYVHFPWCVQKCPYCDFNSHQQTGDLPESAYVAALLTDVDQDLLDPWPRPIHSIFMGGGTPSLFSGKSLQTLLDGLRRRLDIAEDAEITLEANPGTVDEGHFAAYRAAGINRLSLGAQSFNATHLKALGRIHDPAAIVRAVQVAKAVGFDNFNLDLMFALPTQTLAQSQEDLVAALELQPTHLSFYHLTLEPNTAFARHPPPLPDQDLAYDMLEQGQRLLAQAGFVQYETSAYALPDKASRHNLNYWRFGDYLGIGAGAHGKRGLRRRAKHKHPKRYLETVGTPANWQEDHAIENVPFDFCLNALRLHEGFSEDHFTAHTGLGLEALEPALSKLVRQGLLQHQSGRIAATARGRDFLNQVLGAFL